LRALDKNHIQPQWSLTMKQQKEKRERHFYTPEALPVAQPTVLKQ